MRAGDVDLVVVGADRIAANGDTANKIGTYTVAVLAHEHKIPFYVAAPFPLSTSQPRTAATSRSRSATEREVTHIGTSRLTPEGARIRNPAFDVTPHRYITGIITEKGIFEPPYSESLKRAIRRPPPESARNRNVVRRDRRGSPRRDRRSRPPLGDPLEHRGVTDGDPPRVGRRRAGACLAAARARHLRRGRSGPGAGGRVDGGSRRRGGDAGARPRRLAARRCRVREGVRLGARDSGRARASSRRPHRVARPGTRRAAASGRRSRRVGRAHQPLSDHRARLATA